MSSFQSKPQAPWSSKYPVSPRGLLGFFFLRQTNTAHTVQLRALQRLPELARSGGLSTRGANSAWCSSWNPKSALTETSLLSWTPFAFLLSHLFIHLFIYLSMYLFIYLRIYLYIHISMHLCIDLFIYLSIYLLFTYLFIYLFTYLSI